MEEKNRRLAAVIKGVESLDFGNFEDNEIDLFGDAYEFLISNYAANAGKSKCIKADSAISYVGIDFRQQDL